MSIRLLYIWIEVNCLNFEDFPNIIKRLRTQNGLLQEEVARNLNVSVSTVQRWESCKFPIPTTKNLIDICIFFDISLNELIGIPIEKTLDINLLTMGQQRLLKEIILEFRNITPNQTTVSEKQSKIINKLVSEFNK